MGAAQPTEQQTAEATPTPDRRARITIHVVEADGTPVKSAPVSSSDCDIYTVAPTGQTVVFLEPEQVCTIRAGRRDGVLVAWSQTETIEGSVREDEVYLEVPEEETAGLGISIAEHEYGIMVRHVFRQSPAWEAGLRPGDVIVELDGSDTARMELDDFIARATGPVDTEVDIVVARNVTSEDGWEEFTATVVRKTVSRRRG